MYRKNYEIDDLRAEDAGQRPGPKRHQCGLAAPFTPARHARGRGRRRAKEQLSGGAIGVARSRRHAERTAASAAGAGFRKGGGEKSGRGRAEPGRKGGGRPPLATHPTTTHPDPTRHTATPRGCGCGCGGARARARRGTGSARCGAV